MVRAGQRLHDERLRKGYTLEEVEKATKIKQEFLQAIEKGDFHQLPSSAYVYGFVKNYAEFLGQPTREILALFRREFDAEKTFKVLPEGLSRTQAFPIKRIRIRNTLLIVFALFILVGLYILFQFKSALSSPTLNIQTPKEQEVIHGSNVLVSGKTDTTATVFINNDEVLLDSNGNFQKIITLFPGKTTVSVKAVNRLGKEATIERHITIQ